MTFESARNIVASYPLSQQTDEVLAEMLQACVYAVPIYAATAAGMTTQIQKA